MKRLKINYTLNSLVFSSNINHSVKWLRSNFQSECSLVYKIALFPCILLFSITIYAQDINTTSLVHSIKSDSSKNISAQISTDSINIGQIVQAQINSARMKILNEKKQEPVPIIIMSNANKPDNLEIVYTQLRNKIPFSDDLLIKFFILGSAVIISSFFILFRRLRRSRMSINSELKNNIKLLREEKIFRKKDNKLSVVRNKLASLSIPYKLSDFEVTQKAREMNISKEEIYLAAKIKYHERNITK